MSEQLEVLFATFTAFYYGHIFLLTILSVLISIALIFVQKKSTLKAKIYLSIAANLLVLPISVLMSMLLAFGIFGDELTTVQEFLFFSMFQFIPFFYLIKTIIDVFNEKSKK